MKHVQIGRQSAAFVRRGHPWLRPDRFTRGLERCQSGEPITLVDERGASVASALADPDQAIAARVYHQRGNKRFDPAAALQRAWQQRADLHRDPATTAYRLVHGEADFLPGLRIERYDQVWVCMVRAPCLLPYREHIIDCLRHLIGTLPNRQQAIVVWRQHLDDVRRQHSQHEVISNTSDTDTYPAEHIIWAQELAVRWPCTPFAGIATGIYVDQRGPRQYLRQRATGQRVLNCFAYSGLFSISLLAAGAAQADDVDIAGPALALGAEAANANGVTARHHQYQADCLTWCQQRALQQPESYDLIICDPPTAAPGKQRHHKRGKRQQDQGWLARRDYPQLLEHLSRLLAPGGLLYACSNTLSGKLPPLAEWVDQAGLAIEQSPSKLLATDIPQRSGFPEGRPFQAVFAVKQ